MDALGGEFVCFLVPWLMVIGGRGSIGGHPLSLGLSKSTLGDGPPLEIGCRCIWMSTCMGLMLELMLELLMGSMMDPLIGLLLELLVELMLDLLIKLMLEFSSELLLETVVSRLLM